MRYAPSLAASQLAAASERVRAALAQMDALAAAAGGKPGELAEAVQAEEAAEDAADDAADAKAHRRSRLIKWMGLTGLVAHWLIFARLTYWRVPWRTVGAAQRNAAANPNCTPCALADARPARARELSWDVMEPAAFLVGQAWIVISYVYFMVRFGRPLTDRRVAFAACTTGFDACRLTFRVRRPRLSSATKTWTVACGARSARMPRGCAPCRPPPRRLPERRGKGRWPGRGAAAARCRA